MRSVLVADDEQDILDLVATVLESNGMRIACVQDGEKALATLRQNEFDLLLCDYHMPGTGGPELLRWLQDSGKPTKVIVLSGDSVQDDTRSLIETLGGVFLQKPFGIDDLLSAVRRIMPE